jgi:hypothetical protein
MESKKWWQIVSEALKAVVMWFWSGILWVFRALVNKVKLLNGLIDDLLVDASGWRNKLIITVWIIVWFNPTNWIYMVCATVLTGIYIWRYDSGPKV